MKHVGCYLCESPDFDVIDEQNFDDEYLHYIDAKLLAQPRYWKACKSCGLVYHDPRLDEQDVVALYEERYRRHSLKDTTTPDQFFDKIVSIPKSESENYNKVAWLKPRLLNFMKETADPAMLDIGCSAGMLIKLFLDDMPGWSGAGVEPTKRFAEVAGRRVGVPVRSEIYRSGLFGRKFNLITLVHVLEHTIDPVRFLSEIRKDLAEGGLVFIEVPDIADFGNLPPTHDRFMCPHIYYFSVHSAGQLFSRAGLRVVESDCYVSSRGHANMRLLCAATTDDNKTAQPIRSVGDDDALSLRRGWTERQAVGRTG